MLEGQEDERGRAKTNRGLWINTENTFKLSDCNKIMDITLQNVSGRERACRKRAQQRRHSGRLGREVHEMLKALHLEEHLVSDARKEKSTVRTKHFIVRDVTGKEDINKS